MENKLCALYGVLGAQVNLAAERVLINYIQSVSGAHEFQSALRGIGYTLLLDAGDKDQVNDLVEEHDVDELTPLFRRFIFSSSMAILILLSGVGSIQNFFQEYHSILCNILMICAEGDLVR